MLGKPLGWGPLNNQPHIHLIYSGYLLGIAPFFQGLLRGPKQLPPKGPFPMFPMKQIQCQVPESGFAASEISEPKPCVFFVLLIIIVIVFFKMCSSAQ